MAPYNSAHGPRRSSDVVDLTRVRGRGQQPSEQKMLRKEQIVRSYSRCLDISVTAGLMADQSALKQVDIKALIKCTSKLQTDT